MVKHYVNIKSETIKIKVITKYKLLRRLQSIQIKIRQNKNFHNQSNIKLKIHSCGCGNVHTVSGCNCDVIPSHNKNNIIMLQLVHHNTSTVVSTIINLHQAEIYYAMVEKLFCLSPFLLYHRFKVCFKRISNI